MLTSDAKLSGIFHLTPAGQTSWFGFASAIREHLVGNGEQAARVLPIPTTAYPTPAQRPLNSVLSNARLISQTALERPSWERLLTGCMGELMEGSASNSRR
jgi:dTDP-4-dehydrorhamnose reductase